MQQSKGTGRAAPRQTCPGAVTGEPAEGRPGTQLNYTCKRVAILCPELNYPQLAADVISPARLAAFIEPGDPDLRPAFARYIWNMALSEALYVSISGLEVALRNSIHNSISAVLGRVDWYDTPRLLQGRQSDMLADAKTELRRRHAPLEPGRIVAELTFGFWAALFQRAYHGPIWYVGPALRRAFPAAPGSALTPNLISGKLHSIKGLRNRAFHHEPVWNRPDLLATYNEIQLLLSWINLDWSQLLAVADRFPAVQAAGPAPIETSLP